MFTSQVIQQNVFHILCLSIWWRHDIWISEKLKLDYLKNEKSFRGEIKNILPCFTSDLLDIKKQIIKNVADTTFKLLSWFPALPPWFPTFFVFPPRFPTFPQILCTHISIPFLAFPPLFSTILSFCSPIPHFGFYR